jgi:hypothetical protein
LEQLSNSSLRFYLLPSADKLVVPLGDAGYVGIQFLGWNNKQNNELLNFAYTTTGYEKNNVGPGYVFPKAAVLSQQSARRNLAFNFLKGVRDKYNILDNDFSNSNFVTPWSVTLADINSKPGNWKKVDDNAKTLTDLLKTNFPNLKAENNIEPSLTSIKNLDLVNVWEVADITKIKIKAIKIYTQRKTGNTLQSQTESEWGSEITNGTSSFDDSREFDIYISLAYDVGSTGDIEKQNDIKDRIISIRTVSDLR